MAETNAAGESRGRRCLGGFLVRRECWVPSRRGWLLALTVGGGMFFAIWLGLYPFLALTTGGRGDVMVVDGWIGKRKLDRAAAVFAEGHYQCAVVVKDVRPDDDKWSSGKYFGDYVADSLVAHGLPREKVFTLFLPVAERDRTYACALAFKGWLREKGLQPKVVDIVTMGPHARRSRLLYQIALGHEVEIGVIALEEGSYHAASWWRSSAGVRDVLGEAIAYLYARILFRPSNEPAADKEQSRTR